MKSAVIMVGLVFVAVAMWWMESRFGAQFAMAVVGSLVGAGIIITGVMLGLASNKISLMSAAEFHRETMRTEQARIGLDRDREKGRNEVLKIERIYTEARTKHDLIDAKRVDQIAQQRAKLIAKPEDAATWGVDVDDVDFDMEMPRLGREPSMGQRVVNTFFGNDEEW